MRYDEVKGFDLFHRVRVQPVFHLALCLFGRPVGHQCFGHLVKVVAQHAVHAFAALAGNGRTVAYKAQVLHIVIIGEELVQVFAHVFANAHIVAHNVAHERVGSEAFNKAVIHYQLHAGIHNALRSAAKSLTLHRPQDNHIDIAAGQQVFNGFNLRCGVDAVTHRDVHARIFSIISSAIRFACATLSPVKPWSPEGVTTPIL